MARDCVEHLLNDPESTMRLTSSQHVKVIMETVGQAFGLDVEDAPIISRVTDLYKRWLFEHDLGRRPLPVMTEEEYVYLVRVLIFRKRMPPEQLMIAKLFILVFSINLNYILKNLQRMVFQFGPCI
jgi:hypothetical protein